MNELNLHNRLPNDLPDKQTIKDILLELEDTNKFDIKLINLQSTKVDGVKWHANNKPFHEWVEQGKVKIHEAVKETNYHIIRYPMRLDIKLKWEMTSELYSIKRPIDLINTIETYKDVYLRLKDYLGPDIIQDQLDDGIVNGFIIDFIISRVSPNKMTSELYLDAQNLPVNFF